MCMICIDLDNMTLEQAITNLFEMKETIGKPHANEVAVKLAVRSVMKIVNTGEPISDRHLEMMKEIFEYGSGVKLPEIDISQIDEALK